MPTQPPSPTPLWQNEVFLIPALVVGAIVAVLAFIVWSKGRPAATGAVFRASRLSSGNHVFPTQVVITPTSVLQYTPRWIGRHEHSINVAHVSSVRIDTGLLFSDVFIETTGGANPIHCRGHRKADAVRMKELIEQYQTEYYRSGADAKTGPPPRSVDS